MPKFQKTTSFLKSNKEWLISWTVIVVSVTLLIKFWPQGPSPVPAAIKGQVDFAIIYPKGYEIDARSWKYLRDTRAVQFTAKKDDYNIVVTEQKTPLEYQDDMAAYNRFIGSLKPRASFNVALGSVSIANFVTAAKYEVVGETGILNTRNTLILAHPDMQLTDAQWRGLFESLKID